MKKYLSCVIIIAVSFTNQITVSAQWTQSSGTFGGIVETIIRASGTSQPLLAGSNGGGVFISTDQGLHWAATANTGLTDHHVHALLSAAGGTIAGTDAGIFLSTNNGAIWLPASTGQINKDTVNALLLKSDTIFAGTSHGVYTANEQTLDWTRIDNGFTDDYYIHTFFLSDTNLLAGTFQFGVWRSTDDGLFWNQSNTGLTKSDMHAFARYNTNLFVGTDGGLLFASSDNGHTWFPVSVNFSASVLTSLVFIGSNLYIGSDAGVTVSGAAGHNWHLMNTGFLNNHDIRLLYQQFGMNLLASLGDSTLWSILIPNDVHDKEKNIVSVSNYPNPFSKQTTIKFSSSDYGLAKISVVNILGEEVAQIFSGLLEAGDHSYIWDANSITPGMYWCIVNMDGEIFRQPLVCLNRD